MSSSTGFFSLFCGVRRRGNSSESGVPADPYGCLFAREFRGVFEGHECIQLHLKSGSNQADGSSENVCSVCVRWDVASAARDLAERFVGETGTACMYVTVRREKSVGVANRLRRSQPKKISYGNL